MLSLRWRANAHLVVVVTSMLALLGSCSPLRQAYFQPGSKAPLQASFHSESATEVDTLPVADNRIAPDQSVATGTQPVATPALESPLAAPPTTAELARHRNPESRPVTRFRRLFVTGPIAHVAPRRQTDVDIHSPARKTHRLAWVALVLAGLAYVPVLLAGASTLAWVLSLTLPLTAVLLGVASLTTINRNKDRYRGKGWAMAAVLLGTGVLGLALVAVAALSVSNVVWERK